MKKKFVSFLSAVLLVMPFVISSGQVFANTSTNTTEAEQTLENKNQDTETLKVNSSEESPSKIKENLENKTSSSFNTTESEQTLENKNQDTETLKVNSSEESPSKIKENLENKTSSSLRSSQTGTWGTTNWTFDDDSGVLSLSSGTLGTAYESPWSSVFQGLDPLEITKIIISKNTQAPVDSTSLFANLSNLIAIDGLQNLDTSLSTNMTSMFARDKQLVSLDLSQLNTSKVMSMVSMFSGAISLTNYNFNNFDTSNVTDMSFMFASTESGNLDLSTFDTSNVVNMASMFEHANLTSINLSSFNTSKVTSMHAMFSGNPDLVDLSFDNFNTSSVGNMAFMFEGNSSLKNLDIKNFDTGNVTSMKRMFDGCDSLESIKLGSTFSFISDASLGTPVPVGGKGTGNWIKEEHTSKGYSPIDFMSFYGTNDLTPGTYVAELIGISIITKDSSIYVGDEWKPEDNFINATDSDGNDIPFENISVDTKDVDLTNPGEYEVIYSYEDTSVTSYVIVKENKTAVNVHDVRLYIGEDGYWDASMNFDSAFDKDGNRVPLSSVTVDDSEMTDPTITTPGEYDIKYSYGGVTSIAHVSVTEIMFAINVHDSTIYVGDTWSAEDNFDSAFDKDGNPIPLSDIEVTGDVDTSVAGKYTVTYKTVEATVEAIVTVKDKTLGLIVPDNVDFGSYRLGDENNHLTWNKENKIEVQDDFSLGWQLVVSLSNANHPDLRDYLFYNKQNLDEQGIEIASGVGSSVVSQDFQEDKCVYFDYSNVRGLREDKATLEWSLTPSTKGVEE